MADRKPRARPVNRTALPLLNSGVPGLDDALGGGMPAMSFNVIGGGPGSGKTTLAMQLLFANATPERPGLFVTMLGESSLKMLRYQRRFAFFDREQIGRSVHFLNLSEDALEGDLDVVLTRMIEEVNRLNPSVLVVDSFLSLLRSRSADAPAWELERFIQRIAHQLATWEITSFLVGEYQTQDLRNPVFTVADGILWLTQEVHRNSVVRRLQVIKARGMPVMPGLHTLRISNSGVQVFPRTPERTSLARTHHPGRLSTGIVGLDEMMGGGIPAGDSLVLAGPTGTGKTTFAMRFVAAGLAAGESAVMAIFEEHPDAYLERAHHVDVDLRAAVAAGKLSVIYLRPLDLSVDETLDEIRQAVTALGATRVVIDSISGFEMALAPAFREDFRESLYRLIGALTGLGATIFSTVEVVDASGSGGLRLTGHHVSFLTDDILSQRYIEVDGELRKALVVVKMRGSAHSRAFRRYEITSTGVELGASLREFDAIVGGTPIRQARAPESPYPGLVADEVRVLEALVRAGPTTPKALVPLAGMEAERVTAAVARLIELRFAKRSGARVEAVAQPGRA